MRNAKLILLALSLILLAMMVSCVDDSLEFNPKDNENVEAITFADAYFEDIDDITNMAMMGIPDEDGGRFDNLDDERVACATVTRTGDRDGGTITINFGNGCTDGRGVTRKGQMTITYEGRRFLPGSSVVTSFQDYFVNNFKIEGVRTLSNISESTFAAPKFSITIQNGKVTWPDGSFITREVNHTREWVRGANPQSDEMRISGTASGTNKDQRSYTVEIKEVLIFKRSCASQGIFIPVQGKKELLVDSRQIDIDYGDGTCDRLVSITVNGVTRTITIRPIGQ
ncbi:MAG TPA: hypothetical protein PKC24_14380 [Cyclobacteriaceae bacterium]|nr:hypothetical protein [Cyclobacteriaceae bacterium]